MTASPVLLRSAYQAISEVLALWDSIPFPPRSNWCCCTEDALHHRLFPNEFISKSPFQGVKFLKGSSETTPQNDFLRSPEVSGGPSLVGLSFSAQLLKCRYLLQHGSTEKSLTCRILTQKVTIPQEFPPEKISSKKSPKKFVSSFRICPQIISRSTATGFCYIVYNSL